MAEVVASGRLGLVVTGTPQRIGLGGVAVVLTTALPAPPLRAEPLPARAATLPARGQPPVEPNVHPTWLWAAAQLIPSPQWTFPSTGAAHFGVRWQITPFLYSLGVRRGLRPYRFFVVEPHLRNSGSFELFLSPEYTAWPGPPERGLLGRAGARLYAPLVQRGDYLSCSAGASAFFHDDHVGGAIEIGLYTLAGVLGLQLTHAPAPARRTTTLTLHLRYF